MVYSEAQGFNKKIIHLKIFPSRSKIFIKKRQSRQRLTEISEISFLEYIFYACCKHVYHQLITLYNLLRHRERQARARLSFRNGALELGLDVI